MAKKNTPFFDKGSEVEVTRPDPSFHGTLHPAKIVSPSTQKRSACLIEYSHLVTPGAGDGPPKRLKERVPPSLIRPSLPQEGSRGRRFQRGDRVDAFAMGAWWGGKVVEEAKDGAAYFVHVECLERVEPFAAEELRLHRDWVDGSWVPPIDVVPPQLGSDRESDPGSREEEEPASQSRETPSRSNCPFLIGALVEVKTDEDGLEGSWYSAKIMEKAGPGKFLIEYQTLTKEDDGSKLVEMVLADHLRPHPPEAFAIERYEKDARVDAYFNEGWWEGRVLKVLNRLRYKVFFEDGNDEMVVHHGILRPHQEWSNGEWIM